MTLGNIQKSVMDMLKTLTVENFQRCYQKWEQHLHRCVAAQGDNIDVKKKFKNQSYYFFAPPHIQASDV